MTDELLCLQQIRNEQSRDAVGKIRRGLTRLALTQLVSNMRDLRTDFLSEIVKTRLNRR